MIAVSRRTGDRSALAMAALQCLPWSLLAAQGLLQVS